LAFDAVVIGSGIGGLSAASILASQGRSVCVLEAHEHVGGAAHEWSARGYRFENGPSLYAGLSPARSPNPLKHVFQVIGEEPEWITYDRWGFSSPSTKFAAAVGADDFHDRILPAHGGPDAQAQWRRLLKALEPLGSAIFALPPAAIREDPFAALTLGVRFAPALAGVLTKGDLSRPFAAFLDDLQITDSFLRNWLDMLAFLLQGATTEEAPISLMAYMLSDFYRPGVTLDYPVDGTKGIVDALLRGILKGGQEEGGGGGGLKTTTTRKKKCCVRTKAEVAELDVAFEGKGETPPVLRGVKLTSGEVIPATHVICNADLWSTKKLVVASKVPALEAYLQSQIDRVEPCRSFLHLHLGIDATGLPSEPSEAFPAQWAFLEDADRGVDAERNLALVSVASMLDPSLAPKGKHVVHAYVPATEPFEKWAHYFKKPRSSSPEYKAAKEEAVQILWTAVEQYIPDVRDRVDLQFAATPLTHARFLRKFQGTYGPYLPASKGELLMGHRTPLNNFWLCGDSTFPGIGVPAVAASGLITANSILSPAEHWQLLDRIKL